MAIGNCGLLATEDSQLRTRDTGEFLQGVANGGGEGGLTTY